jgi:hypothetical protein
VRFVGGFVRPPEMIAAAAGFVLLARRDWRRALLPLALIALNVLTFVLVAGRHGPLEQRYLMVAAGMVLVFAGYAIAQLIVVPAGVDPRERRIARAAGVLLALACVAYSPIDIRRIDDLHDQVNVADAVYGDLRDSVEGCAPATPVHVTDVRLRPFVAYWGDVAPRRVGTEPGATDVVALTGAARELSSRSLPSDPSTSVGAPPFWRIQGCAPQ